MNYRIRWGKIDDVLPGDTEGDAWCAFCARYSDAARHPKSHVRTFDRLQTVAAPEPAPAVSPSAEPAVLTEPSFDVVSEQPTDSA